MKRTPRLLDLVLLASGAGLGLLLGCQPVVREFGGTGGHASSQSASGTAISAASGSSSAGGTGGTGGMGGPGNAGGAGGAGTTSVSVTSTTVASSSSGGGCMTPETLCGAACIPLASDSKNCGACGHDCLGGACSASVCQPIMLAMGQANPLGLSMDDARLYWANEQGGAVKSVSKGGGSVVSIASNQSSPWATASDGTRVYWVTINGGTLMSAPVGGGASMVLLSGLNSPSAVVLSGNEVVYSDSSGIFSLPKGGGAKTQVSSHATAWLALDASYAYFTDYGNGAVLRVSFATGGQTTLSTGLSSPSGLALFGGYVYVGSGGSVMKIPAGGGMTVPIAMDPSGGPSSVGTDGAYVYWTNSGNNTLSRVPVAGGPSAIVAKGQDDPSYVIADSAAIYWLNVAGGTVMKLAK